MTTVVKPWLGQTCGSGKLVISVLSLPFQPHLPPCFIQSDDIMGPEPQNILTWDFPLPSINYQHKFQL